MPQATITPNLIEGNLANLLRSSMVDIAIQHNQPFTPDLVEFLANNGAPASDAIRLLEPQMTTMPIEQICRILESLGGGWAASTPANSPQKPWPSTTAPTCSS